MNPIVKSALKSRALPALFLLAASLAPVAAQETAAAAGDVERFCTNITDAARDQRYAMQAAELQRLQGEIDERLAALEAKRAEYEEWLARRNAFLDQAQDVVVEIYAKMRPDAAAERLAALRLDLAAGILMKLDARQAGVILNEMESEIAARVTMVMASAARTKDPS